MLNNEQKKRIAETLQKRKQERKKNEKKPFF